MSGIEEKISQFVSVTGCSVEIARRYLDACAGNLDMAVGVLMENDASSASFGALPVPSVARTTETNNIPLEPLLSPKSYEET